MPNTSTIKPKKTKQKIALAICTIKKKLNKQSQAKNLKAGLGLRWSAVSPAKNSEPDKG